MTQSTSTDGYSSKVRGWLQLAGQRLPLAQVGPGRCTLRDRIELEPAEAEAELVIEIDGDAKSSKVCLTNVASTVVSFRRL